MQFRWSSFAILISSLTCCNKSEPVATTVTAESGAQVEISKPAATPAPVFRSLPLSKQVSSSTLRVRYAIGGTAPVEYPAVLLHHSETVGADARVQWRFVLAHVPGREELQLRHPSCKIQIHRNKFNESGVQTGIGFPAWLVRVDEASGLALFGYVDEFDYKDDAGLRVERKPEISKATAVRTYFESPDTSTANPVGSQSLDQKPLAPGETRQQLFQWAAFRLEGGSCQKSGKTNSELQLPEWGKRTSSEEIGFLVIGEQDILLGFATEGPSHAAKFTPIGDFNLSAALPSVTPLSVNFKQYGGTICEVRFDRGDTPANSFNFYSRENPSESFYHDHTIPSSEGRYPPIYEQIAGEPGYVRHNVSYNQNTSPETRAVQASVSGDLPFPVRNGEEKTYIVQMALSGRGLPVTTSHPFLIKLRRDASGLFPMVTGLTTGPDLVDAEKNTPSTLVTSEKKMVLESTVRQIRPIREGRELLFQFDGTPYWKRFSLEAETWLPLPNVDLAGVQITGNRDSLFVLDQSRHEVQKYWLDDMSLTVTGALPPDVSYFTLLAGPSSNTAPVHVLSRSSSISLSPLKLNRVDIPVEVTKKHYETNRLYEISGDGLSIWSGSDTPTSLFQTYSYASLGADKKFHSFPNVLADFPCGISGAFQLGRTGVMTKLLPALFGAAPAEIDYGMPKTSRFNQKIPMLGQDASHPFVYKISQGNSETIPPVPSRIEFFSLFDTSPFLTLDTPEFTAVVNAPNFTLRRWVFLEPETFKLGTLAPDQRTWTVRHLTKPAKLDRPILLNWPESALEPGEKYEYRPQILGVDAFQAEIVNRPQAATLSSDKSTVAIQLSPDEFAPMLILKLKLQQKQHDDVVCEIPIFQSGFARPVAVSAALDQQVLEALNAGMPPLDLKPEQARGIKTRVIGIDDAVAYILGTVGDFAVLQHVSGKIGLLSIPSGQIEKTLSFGSDSTVFTGAGGLYEFNSGSRVLSRFGVPDGRREGTVTIPNELKLKGVGIGSDQDSPVTLLIEGTTDQTTERFGDLWMNVRRFDRALVVLSNRLDRRQSWAQPVSQDIILKSETTPPKSNPLNFMMMNGQTAQMPTSFNGRVVCLPKLFCVIGSAFSTLFEMGTDTHGLLGTFDSDAKRRPNGSLSGFITATKGKCYWGGKKLPAEGFGPSLYPSGRYQWNPFHLNPSNWKHGSSPSPVLELRIVENHKLISRLANLPILDQMSSYENGDAPAKHVFPLNDTGLVALLSPPGKFLQLVDLNLQVVSNWTAPDELHVVSQPQFYVAENVILDYQVRVNKPELVSEFRLQSPVQGASMDQQGQLHYVQPPGMKAPAKVRFTIEIKSKTGEVFIHEFPLQILALPKSTQPLKPQPKVSI